jgi:hypothetical protein
VKDSIFKETNPLPPRDEDDIRVYTCGNCGEKGHSRTTCGMSPQERIARQRGRK